MVKAGLTVDVGGGWTVQPALQYYFPLSSAAKRAATAPGGSVNGPLEGLFVFGATLVRSF